MLDHQCDAPTVRTAVLASGAKAQNGPQGTPNESRFAPLAWPDLPILPHRAVCFPHGTASPPDQAVASHGRRQHVACALHSASLHLAGSAPAARLWKLHRCCSMHSASPACASSLQHACCLFPVPCRRYDRRSPAVPRASSENFSAGCRSVQPQIREVLAMCTGGDPEWSVTTTGHSLGGALATVCAFDFAISKYAPHPCVFVISSWRTRSKGGPGRSPQKLSLLAWQWFKFGLSECILLADRRT